MSTLKEIVEVSKNFKLLYVEDDEFIQNEMKTILGMFFKEVVVANDGQEGLELLELNSDVDLIISDIKMPRMDGLDMAREIRKKDKSIPIILITAFNDQDFFLKSIEVKVDRYILKPIQDDILSDVIWEVSNSLYEKKEYLKLKAQDEQRKIEEKQKEAISKMTDAFVSPTIIFEGGEVVFYSKSFMELFQLKSIDFKNLKKDAEIFDDKKGYIKSLSRYDDKDLVKNHVVINQRVGKKIFKIVKKDIKIGTKTQEMFMLVDITMEEYQKVKIESYVKSLESMVIKKKKDELLSDKDEATIKDENRLKLDDKKTSKLRKRHHHIMTSEELINYLDDYVITELQELDDLDKDLSDFMFGFSRGDFAELQRYSELLQKYADEIYIVDEFEDLYSSVKSLADILHNFDISVIDESKYSEFALYLSSVVEDLALWRKSIFVDQNTDNIHYLDSSLFSTALHIEMLVNKTDDVDTQEDDLEFF